jgi:hypothetical protein
MFRNVKSRDIEFPFLGRPTNELTIVDILIIDVNLIFKFYVNHLAMTTLNI